MKRIPVIIALFLAVPLIAQTAKVIQLSPEEAKQAKVLHAEQDSIAKKIVEFDQAIRARYLSAPKDQEGHTQTYLFNGSWFWVKDGWGAGNFQYSEDFKFIVPAVVPQYSSPYGFGGGCVQLTPGIGIGTLMTPGIGTLTGK